MGGFIRRHQLLTFNFSLIPMPSPKSGKSGTAKPPIDPRKAGEAGNAKSGSSSQAQAKAIQKKAKKHGLTKVKPGTSSIVPLSPPPVTPKTEKRNDVCTDVGLFKDAEDRRCSSSRVLEIVPPILSSSDSITFENKNKCSCSGPVYQLDGHGKLPLSQPATISAINEELRIDNLEDLSRGFHFSPRTAPISFLCGKDNSKIESGELRIFPNDKQKISWDVTEIFRKHPDLATLINKLAEFSSKMTGKTVDPIKGFSITAGLIYVKIAAPEFKFSFEGNWEEYASSHVKHWQAYYKFKVALEGTLFSIKFKVDLISVLSYLPQIAPFKPIYDEVWDKIRDRLTEGDGPPFYFGVGGDLKGNVKLERTPDWQPSGEIKLSGSLFLGVFVKTGILEAELEASTGLFANLDARGEGESAYLYYNAFKFDGMKGKVSITLEAGWVGKWGYEREVTILEESKDAWPWPNGKLPLIR